MTNNALHKAIEIAGSQTELARRLGKYPQLVHFWTTLDRVPAKWVVPIEQATGVKREDLRPDIFG